VREATDFRGIPCRREQPAAYRPHASGPVSIPSPRRLKRQAAAPAPRSQRRRYSALPGWGYSTSRQATPAHRRPRVAVIHYQRIEFCTNPQRNPENVRIKYIEGVPSRGPPIRLWASEDPIFKRSLWALRDEIAPEIAPRIAQEIAVGIAAIVRRSPPAVAHLTDISQERPYCERVRAH
jgi:hypothetical protein